MLQYHNLLKHVLDNGVKKQDRTGVGTLSVFGYQTRYDLGEYFPLLTTKKVYIRGIIHELLWFLKGDTNIQYLVNNNVNIWNEWVYQVYLEKNNLLTKYPRYTEAWREKMVQFIDRLKTDDNFANEYGDLGPVYGKQWRRWQSADGSEIDQIKNALELIQNDPTSRRIIVSGWNVGEIMGLVRDHNHAPPPCHSLFQFMVVGDKLNCQLYQRSADAFLGVPFNIASYALLTCMMAHVSGLVPGEFVHTFGDLHIYLNHLNQVEEQLSRDFKTLPTITLNKNITSLFDFSHDDIVLNNYESHPAIKAPIAV